MDLKSYKLKFIKSKPDSIRLDLCQYKTETLKPITNTLPHCSLIRNAYTSHTTLSLFHTTWPLSITAPPFQQIYISGKGFIAIVVRYYLLLGCGFYFAYLLGRYLT